MKRVNWRPIGSVLKLLDYQTEIVIISRGFILPSDNSFKYYDYCGIDANVEYFKSPLFLFNNEDIETIIFEGWKSEKQAKLEQKFYVNVISKGVKKATKVIEHTPNERSGF